MNIVEKFKRLAICNQLLFELERFGELRAWTAEELEVIKLALQNLCIVETISLVKMKEETDEPEH